MNASFRFINPSCPGLDIIIASSIGEPTAEKIHRILVSYEASNQYLIGAFSEDKLIGVIGFEFAFPYVSIRHISVAENYRNKGIGKQLIENIAKHFDLYQIKCETDRDAVGFYESLGFRCELYQAEYGIRYSCSKALKHI